MLTKLKPENANFVISFLTPPKKNKKKSFQRSAWAEESSPEPTILTTIYNFLRSDQTDTFSFDDDQLDPNTLSQIMAEFNRGLIYAEDLFNNQNSAQQEKH